MKRHYIFKWQAKVDVSRICQLEFMVMATLYTVGGTDTNREKQRRCRS